MFSREQLEKTYGKVWDTEEFIKEFAVLYFFAPFVQVRHCSSGKKGTAEFQHEPRFYYNFIED